MNPTDVSDTLRVFQETMAKLNEQLKPIFENIAKSIIEYKKNAPEYYYLLSNYGWYLDMEITPGETKALVDLIHKNDINELNQFLSDYYTGKLLRIEDKLTKNHLNRKAVIKEAFMNHKKARYFSSITLFLTQADGFCYDKSRKFYFKNNKQLTKSKVFKPQIEEELEREPYGLLNFILAPLEKPTAINDHSSNLKNFPIRLNRHEILHGVDIEFGSKLNSLKILSFLNYVDDILNNT